MNTDRINELLEASQARAKARPETAHEEIADLILFLAELQRDSVMALYEAQSAPTIHSVMTASRMVNMLHYLFGRPVDSTRAYHEAFKSDSADLFEKGGGWREGTDGG
jgi:hypothetical protein